METFKPPFPPKPAGASDAIVKPSPAFKKQVYKSIAAIALLLLTYALTFCASIAIAGVFGFLGVKIMSSGLSYLGILTGVAFIIAGALLVFFVIKFLFKRSPRNSWAKIEVTRAEDPKLFAFIDELTREIGAPKPKRIFITTDVNAGVTYTSNFWSMFFPVRKNLLIGLGLVNSLNVSEFKAVMAHEFGHFSQRSMILGSYVNNVNKIVYNMLFENESYKKLLESWGRIHSMFRLMAFINDAIIRGMQVILKKVYVVANKTNLALSREMEYHADTIAANSAGANQVISSIKRYEIGEACYNSVLDFLTASLQANKRSKNLYEQHTSAIRLYCEKEGFKIGGDGLPVEISGTKRSNLQITIEDPWSTHPLTDERERHAGSLNLFTETINYPAWSIFEQPEQLQIRATEVLYSAVTSTDTPTILSQEDFDHAFLAALNAHNYDPIFKDFFDRRELTQFDLDEAVLTAANTNPISFGELFSEDNVHLPSLVSIQQQNLVFLEQLTEIRKDVKYFHYCGERFSRLDIAGLQGKIEKEMAAALSRIKELDKSIFCYFYNIDKNPGTRLQLIEKYRSLFECQKEAVVYYDLYTNLTAAMKPVYGRMKPAQIRETVNRVYREEKKAKPRMRELVMDEAWKDYINDEDLIAVNTYLNSQWVYYMDPGYDSTALGVFSQGMQTFYGIVYKKGAYIKKALLDFEATLLTQDAAEKVDLL